MVFKSQLEQPLAGRGGTAGAVHPLRRGVRPLQGSQGDVPLL